MDFLTRKKFQKFLEKAKNVKDTNLLFSTALSYSAKLSGKVKFLIDNFNNLPYEKKLYVIAALLYLVSPIDAIPDIIPVAGLSDDAAVLAYVAYEIIKSFNE